MSDSTQCRCPVRPYYNPGSFGSGSTTEARNLRRWQDEHGAHEYAMARDELAKALEAAEERVKSGAAVLDMVADIFNLPRHERLQRSTEGERCMDELTLLRQEAEKLAEKLHRAWDAEENGTKLKTTVGAAMDKAREAGFFLKDAAELSVAPPRAGE